MHYPPAGAAYGVSTAHTSGYRTRHWWPLLPRARPAWYGSKDALLGPIQSFSRPQPSWPSLANHGCCLLCVPLQRYYIMSIQSQGSTLQNHNNELVKCKWGRQPAVEGTDWSRLAVTVRSGSFCAWQYTLSLKLAQIRMH